jgi:hypothetical protein
MPTTRKHLAVFSVLASGVILAALPAIGEAEDREPISATTPGKAKARPAPEWVLPQKRARERAKTRKVPLLVVSLNGNLDGYC